MLRLTANEKQILFMKIDRLKQNSLCAYIEVN